MCLETKNKKDQLPKIQCPSCGKCFRVEPFAGSYWMKCPRCKKELRIPWIHYPSNEPGRGKMHLSKKDRKRWREFQKRMLMNLHKPRNFKFKERED